jgi:hypothetical protein
MKVTKLDPHCYPLALGESWWIVHPNNGTSEFVAPVGAIAFCTEDFLSFGCGTVYSILNNDSDNGWITLASYSHIVEMPYYVFARHFDAEAFVRGRMPDPTVLERAVPFDYKPTVPSCKSCERNEG